MSSTTSRPPTPPQKKKKETDDSTKVAVVDVPRNVVLNSSKDLTFQKIVSWKTFDIFNVAEDSSQYLYPLLFEIVLGNGRGGFGAIETLGVSRKRLYAALSKAQNTYDNPYLGSFNPYHHALHGADVFCTVSGALAALSPNVVAKTNILSPLALFSIGIAALLHDYRHVGVNNTFLVNMSHDVALRYSDDSVLERLHASEALTLLHDFDVLNFLPRSDRIDFRKEVLGMILATDFSRGLATVKKIQGIFPGLFDVPRNSFDTSSATVATGTLNSSGERTEDKDEHRRQVMRLIVECSDVSHPSKPLHIHKRWALLVTEEFFDQGDAEEEAGLPVVDFMSRKKMTNGGSWARSLDGFITYAVMPKWLGLTPLFKNPTDWTDAITHNIDFWRSESTRPGASFGATWKEVSEKDSAFAKMLKMRPSPWVARPGGSSCALPTDRSEEESGVV
eukprot:g2740.t1